MNTMNFGCCGLCGRPSQISEKARTSAKVLVSVKAQMSPKLWLPSWDKFIPLWAHGRTLYYRVNEPNQGRRANIINAFAEAIRQWGDAAPIQFEENNDVHDFVIFVNPFDQKVEKWKFVLADAFYPASMRNTLTLFPKLFTLPPLEQAAALAHEIGHVFGLSHNFTENGARKEPFGDTGRELSIMNYAFGGGVVTSTDKSDLKKLYNQVWSGTLQNINGVSITQVVPHHDIP